MTCKHCGHESHCGYPLRKDVNNPYDRTDLRHNPPVICTACYCPDCTNYWLVTNRYDHIVGTCRTAELATNIAQKWADETGEVFHVTKYSHEEYWSYMNEMATTVSST